MACNGPKAAALFEVKLAVKLLVLAVPTKPDLLGLTVLTKQTNVLAITNLKLLSTILVSLIPLLLARESTCNLSSKIKILGIQRLL